MAVSGLIGFGLARWATAPRARAGRRTAEAEGRPPAEIAQFTKRVAIIIALRLAIIGAGVAGLVVLAVVNDLFTWPVLILTTVVFLSGAALSGLGRPVELPGPPPQPAPPTAYYAPLPVAPPPVQLDHVQLAFARAGIGSDRDPVRVEQEGRTADGWTADVDLGPGRTPDQALARRARIASGLDVPADRLHLEELGQRRVRVHVADRAPSTEVVRSELADGAPRSIFDPVPIGQDQRGRPVAVSMVRQGVLLGGRPQFGKTTTARLFMAAAALDPAVDLWVLDGKGGADWSALAPLCRRYVSGDDQAAAASVLAEVLAEMRATFAAMPGDETFSRGRITPAAAAAGHRLHLVLVDEVQVFLGGGPGRQVLDLLADLARRGPAAGVMLLVATQRPAAETIPAVLRDQLGVRIALATTRAGTSDTILYPGAAKDGHDASRIKRPGVAFVLDQDDPVLTRIDDLDEDAMDQVIARARLLRPASAPTPSIEQSFDGGGDSQLVALAVSEFRPGEPAVATADLLARLQAKGHCLDLDARQFGRALAAAAKVSPGEWRPGGGAPKVRGFRYVDLVDSTACPVVPLRPSR